MGVVMFASSVWFILVLDSAVKSLIIHNLIFQSVFLRSQSHKMCIFLPSVIQNLSNSNKFASSMDFVL